MVHKHRIALHCGEGAIGAECDRAQIVIIADTGHDEVAATGGGGRGRREDAAIFAGPFFGLCLGAVVDGYLVSALLDEMPGHGVAHDAEPEKRDGSHSILRTVCSCFGVFSE